MSCHNNSSSPCLATGVPAAPFDWNGRSGEVWRDNQVRLDRMLAPCGDAALRAAAAQPGERVLDIGCGSGATTLDLATRVGADGHVLGLDISEPLLARARERAAPGQPVRFALADAARHPLPERSFDLLFSRFGVMFFGDPVAAFTHLRHALVPTGRLAFVCWRAFADNEWVRYPMSAVSDMLPPSAPPGPEAPGPFAFGNADRVRHILTQAGFADVQLAPFDCPLVYGEATSRDDAIDAALELALQVGPISRALAEQAPDVRARAAEAVRAALAAREANNAVVMGGACWIVTARHSSR